MRNTYSLNSRGSSSLRRETSLVMMLESQPSCQNGNESQRGLLKGSLCTTNTPRLYLDISLRFHFRNFLLNFISDRMQSFHIALSCLIHFLPIQHFETEGPIYHVVFSNCFVMSNTYFVRIQNIFCQNPIQYFEREVPKGQHICGHFQYKLPVQTVLLIKMI